MSARFSAAFARHRRLSLDPAGRLHPVQQSPGFVQTPVARQPADAIEGDLAGQNIELPLLGDLLGGGRFIQGEITPAGGRMGQSHAASDRRPWCSGHLRPKHLSQFDGVGGKVNEPASRSSPGTRFAFGQSQVFEAPIDLGHGDPQRVLRGR